MGVPPLRMSGAGRRLRSKESQESHASHAGPPGEATAGAKMQRKMRGKLRRFDAICMFLCRICFEDAEGFMVFEESIKLGYDWRL